MFTTQHKQLQLLLLYMTTVAAPATSARLAQWAIVGAVHSPSLWQLCCMFCRLLLLAAAAAAATTMLPGVAYLPMRPKPLMATLIFFSARMLLPTACTNIMGQHELWHNACWLVAGQQVHWCAVGRERGLHCSCDATRRYLAD